MARLADYFVLVAFGPHPRGECRARGRALRAEDRGPGPRADAEGRGGGQGRRGQGERRPGHLPGSGPGPGVGSGGLPEVHPVATGRACPPRSGQNPVGGTSAWAWEVGEPRGGPASGCPCVGWALATLVGCRVALPPRGADCPFAAPSRPPVPAV